MVLLELGAEVVDDVLTPFKRSTELRLISLSGE
jgi:hypothetical protein